MAMLRTGRIKWQRSVRMFVDKSEVKDMTDILLESIRQQKCPRDHRKGIAVLTGAGCSTDSGIPDYR